MVQRTEYRNLTTETIRGGPTGHGESLLDLESYLIPMARQQNRSQFSAGVIEGLRLAHAADHRGIQVSPGCALDTAGNLIAVVAGGVALVAADIDPEAVENVPVVVVADDGVTVPATGASGSCVVVIRWREVAGTVGSFTRLHAPWLRLVSSDSYHPGGSDLALGMVDVAADGTVVELDTDPRDLARLRTGGLQLWATDAIDDVITQSSFAEISGTEEFALEISLAGARALTIDSDHDTQVHGDLAVTGTLRATAQLSVTGDAGVGGKTTLTGPLTVGGDTTLAGSLTVSGGLGVHSGGAAGGYSFADRAVGTFVRTPTAGERWVWYSFKGSARLWSGGDKLWVDKDGNVGLGIAAGDAIKRTVYIGGASSSGIHIEGSGAGFSFADRHQPPGYVDNPAGQRWVWYAIDGTARLWSGSDALTVGALDDGGGLDVARRMRMRQGGSASAGTWLFQNAPGDGRPQADRAFIGMASYDTVGLFGAQSGWSFVMNVNDGNVRHTGREIGNPGGPYVLNLFGSRIQDIGGGILSFRSGGGLFVFEPGSNVTVHGSVRINGNLSKAGGAFTIDHPLDPGGRYLSHSFVESPERLNLYTGTVITDDHGRATIELPSYFAALNRDPLVQLTAIGQLARVTYCRPNEPDRIQVITDRPAVTVAWQVSGVRDDAWARHNPLIVEEPKPLAERGTYLHADAFAATDPLLGATRAPSPEEIR
jgi:hypothetical protein